MSSSNSIIKLPEGDSWIEIRTLPKELECNPECFQELLNMKPEERGKIKFFGKTYDVPRWHQTYGQDYYFSGVNHEGIENKNLFLKNLLSYVQEDSKQNYNQILVNWYLTGQEYIAKHSDDEASIVPKSAIYSFSFGATRDFVITSKTNKSYRLVLPLKHNSLILMGGEMQKYYKHELPKRLKVKEPRINITMRLYK
jgi:alkylated DNA repair dioxygenase AlkB